MWYQKEILLEKFPRGFHLITNNIISALPKLEEVSVGLLHIYMKHTSASLTINEDADPTVRYDFETFFSGTVPDDNQKYTHTYEGSDDMPAHLKTSILGSSLTIPINNGSMVLGNWQGIYLCEHRNIASRRILVLTINGGN
tara:strand:+ start:518 stop:940 length:423 start_codon:yes stop_codon:yes gene_type:complete